MDPITITAITGVAVTFIVPSLARRQSQRQRYHRMGDRQLVDAQVRAKMMRGVALAIAFLGPIPLSFIIAQIKDPFIAQVMLCIMMATVFSGVTGFWLFFEVASRTTTEIEMRKLQQDK